MDKQTQNYLISVLRAASVTWGGRTQCLNEGRRLRKVGTFKDGRDKFVWEHDCKYCGKWFDQKDSLLEVDHIVEIGPFNGDWTDYINRMFCGQDNLQRLCIPCHGRKTSSNATLRHKRKNVIVLADVVASENDENPDDNSALEFL